MYYGMIVKGKRWNLRFWICSYLLLGEIVMCMDLLMNLKSLDTQHSRSMSMHPTIQWNIMPMNTWTVKRDMIMKCLSLCQMMEPLQHVLQWFLGLSNITSRWYSYTPIYRWRRAIIKYHTRKHGCWQQPICGGSYCIGLCTSWSIGNGSCVINYPWKHYELCECCQG